MKKNAQKTKASISPKQIAASHKLVTKASQPFERAPRLTATERKHLARLKRGAHQIIPLIASIARKHGVVPPDSSFDEMFSSLEYAQALEPLLGAVTVMQQTLKDQYLAHNASAWKTATVAYGMLSKAGEAKQSILDELAPVQEWFRHRSALSLEASAAKGTRKPKRAKPAKVASAPQGTGASVGSNAAHAAP